MKTIALLTFLVALTTSHINAAEMPVILLTGFEPFGSVKVNPSWETVKTFQGKIIAGHRIEAVQLPVVYDEMEKPLLEALAKFKPAFAISFGVGSHVIQVEKIASNSYHPQRPADNKGVKPTRDAIVEDGPAKLPTMLPAAKIIAALKAAKIGADDSKDAGGYLCNECFYRLMIAKDVPRIRGFIHVPDYGTRDPEGGTYDAEKLKRAVEIIVTTVVEGK